MDYTALSLAQVKSGLDEVVRETQAAFGGLEDRQLNWRPDAGQWSVGQCFEHLLTVNRLILQASTSALDVSRPRTIWERMPVLPGVLGRMLIRSQAPESARKYTAPSSARPAASDIAGDIIGRFMEHQRDSAAWLHSLGEQDAIRAIMTSPFIRVVTYSVMDGWRLMLAHDRRHFEQARRVLTSPGFPISAGI